MSQLNPLSVVRDEQLITLPRVAEREAYLRSVQIIGVLDDLDQAMERLDTQLLGTYLRAFEHLAQSTWRVELDELKFA